MCNNVMLIGRLVSDPKITETENDRNVTTITLAIPRNYINIYGIYETDFIKCILWNGIAETTCEYCKKGDLIGIRGRLQTTTTETENGEKKYSMEVIAEKVTFLSNRKSESED